MDKEKMVRELFAAFLGGDRERADALLADDFRFTSPYDDAIDKATYFERCWPNSVRIEELVIERIAMDGDGAFVLYRCRTDAGKRFRNTEFHTFGADRIRAVDVYFGAERK